VSYVLNKAYGGLSLRTVLTVVRSDFFPFKAFFNKSSRKQYAAGLRFAYSGRDFRCVRPSSVVRSELFLFEEKSVLTSGKQYAAGLCFTLLPLKALSDRPPYNGCAAGPWGS
jgi:hypothetical protein